MTGDRMVNVPLRTLKLVEEVLAEQHQNCGGDDTIYAEPLLKVREAMTASHVTAAAPAMFAALEGIRDHAQTMVNDWAACVQEGGSPDPAELRRWNDVLSVIAQVEGHP